MNAIDEMLKRILAQNEVKRREFEDEGKRAFQESDIGRAHAARVAAEREAREASQVQFTADEFRMLEAAAELGFDDLGDEENPEMIASYSAIVAFGLACKRAALLSIGCDSDLIADLDKRIGELK